MKGPHLTTKQNTIKIEAEFTEESVEEKIKEKIIQKREENLENSSFMVDAAASFYEGKKKKSKNSKKKGEEKEKPKKSSLKPLELIMNQSIFKSHLPPVSIYLFVYLIVSRNRVI